jgi:hypothetical protein
MEIAMYIIGTTEEKKNVVLFGANGQQIELTGEMKPVVVEKETEKEMTEEEMVLAEVARLQAELELLKNGGAKKEKSGASTTATKEDAVKKNHKPGKADPNRKYVRVGEFKAFGKVPEQQKDLAAIMSESMEIGAEWTEEELFSLITDSVKEYASLRNSKQDPTYLFRYYRGLKNDGKHAGFIARNFIRMF